MKRGLIFFISWIVVVNAFAQPFVDPLNVRFTRAFHNSKGKGGTPFSHIYVGSDLPLKLNKGSYIVLSPFFENWNLDSAGNKTYFPPVSGLGMAVSVLFPLDKNRWSITTGLIPRINSEGVNMHNSFQIGGLLLAIYKQHEHLKYKFGVYMNNEFFGIFVVPLLGIDWHINSHNNLFGVLPGRLTWEHRLNHHFYGGATFRALTNSYRLNNGKFLRLDDNQLSVYLDCYASKHIAFTTEAGYGILRKIRTGNDNYKNYLTETNWGDGFFIKIGASYRVRL